MIKNIAGQEINFQAIATADGAAVTTGTPVIKVVLDGGTMATGAGTATHKGDGVWHYAPTQAETNANHVSFTFTLTDALNQTLNVYVSAIDYTDAAAILDAAGVRTALGMASADLDTQLDAIVGDTNELQTDWVNGGRLDLLLDAVTGGGGGGGLDAAGVRAAIGLASANLDTQLSTIDSEIATIDTEVGAIQTDVTDILADTNELQTDWVNGGRLDTILDGAGGGSGLDAAGVRAALGMASADLDTQLDDIANGGGGGGLTASGVRAAIGLASANLDAQLGSGQSAYPSDTNADSSNSGIPGIHSSMSGQGTTAHPMSNVQAVDGTVQVIQDDGDIDILYKLNIGDGNTPTGVTFTGIAANGDDFGFRAWDFVASAWDSLFTHTGNGSSAAQTGALSSEYVGTAAGEEGNVYIRIDSTSGGNLSVDALEVTYEIPRITRDDVRAALGMASSNLDTQLTALDTDVTAILEDTNTTIPATITTMQGNVTDILEDTGTTIPATITTIDGEIETLDTALDGHIAEWTNGGRLDNLLDSAGGLTQAEVRTALGVPGGTLENDLDAVKAVVDDILTDTGSTIPSTISTLQSDVTDIDSTVDSISTNTGNFLHNKIDAIDTVVDDIFVDTGVSIPALINNVDSDILVMQGNVTNILADTNSLQSEWANGGRLDSLLDTASSNVVSAASIRSALGMASADLDTQLDAIVADTSELQVDWQNGGRLDNILDSATTGGIDAAGIRSALGLASANLDTQLSTIDTEVGAVQTDVTDILADTNELQGDWANSGRLDTILDTAAAAGGIDAAGVRAAIGLASANLDTQLSTIDGEISTIDTEVGAIQLDVTAILEDTATTIPAAISASGISQADVRTAVGLASAYLDSQLSTIDTEVGAIQTDVTAILEDTGTTIPALLTTIDDNVDDIETATTASAIRAAVGLANADLDTQLGNLGGNLGNGANTVTLTVQEDVGSTPLQAATVRATLGGTTLVGTTDANGEIAFALDSGTWEINVTATGYSSLVSQSLVVSTTTAQTYQLTLTSTIPAPASPNVATGVLTAFDHEGQEEAGVVFTVKLTAGPGLTGQSHDTQGREFTSDSVGLVTCPNLVKFGTYSIQRSNGTTQTFVVPDASSFTIPVTGLLGFEVTP